MTIRKIIAEYHFLLGLDEPNQRQIIRLETLAEYLGRDIEEWRTVRHKKMLETMESDLKNYSGKKNKIPRKIGKLCRCKKSKTSKKLSKYQINRLEYNMLKAGLGCKNPIYPRLLDEFKTTTNKRK